MRSPTRAAAPAGPSADRSVTGALGLGLLACVLLAVSPHGGDYWASLIAIVAFAAAPVLFPSVRARPETPMCPVNWALIVFLFHLVIDPLLIAFDGPYLNTLPFLPGNDAVNAALLLSVLGWVAFVAGCELAPRMHLRAPRAVRALLARPRPEIADTRLAIAFAAVGIVGLAIAFHSPGALVDYFREAGGHLANQGDATRGGLAQSLSVALRPFLAFAVLVVWFRWVERRAPGQPLVWRTLAVAVLVIAASATYSYNRASLVAPILAMVAVYGVRVMRLRVWAVVLAAVLALGVLTVARAYRSSDYTLSQAVTTAKARKAVLSNSSISHELQIYTSAPQYLGFLLDGTGYGAHPHYGRTLFSSALFPVPKLGKPFRDTSGVVIFNRLIYGPDSNRADQVTPFEGELFLDFTVPGVLIGYALIGLAIAKAQRRFERARDAFESYAWQYGAIWIGFLAVGSLAVFSQIALYFFWPVLAYALLRSRRASGRTSTASVAM